MVAFLYVILFLTILDIEHSVLYVYECVPGVDSPHISFQFNAFIAHIILILVDRVFIFDAVV